MTDSDIRRFAELCGWKVTPYGEVSICTLPDSDALLELPRFLATENLHLVMDGLERFCKERNYGYRIEKMDKLRLFIFGRGMIVRADDLTKAFVNDCDALNSAIIKAVLAATAEGSTR